MDRDKVIKGLYAHGYRDCKSCPYWGSGENGQSICTQLTRDALALLKEQQEEIDHLIEENASNAEMAEGLKELLKEQEKKKRRWLQCIADNQLASSPIYGKDDNVAYWHKRGIWDGLQMSYEILTEEK